MPFDVCGVDMAIVGADERVIGVSTATLGAFEGVAVTVARAAAGRGADGARVASGIALDTRAGAAAGAVADAGAGADADAVESICRTASGESATCAVANSRNAPGSGLADASSRFSASRI